MLLENGGEHAGLHPEQPYGSEADPLWNIKVKEEICSCTLQHLLGLGQATVFIFSRRSRLCLGHPPSGVTSASNRAPRSGRRTYLVDPVGLDAELPSEPFGRVRLGAVLGQLALVVVADRRLFRHKHWMKVSARSNTWNITRRRKQPLVLDSPSAAVVYTQLRCRGNWRIVQVSDFSWKK